MNTNCNYYVYGGRRYMKINKLPLYEVIPEYAKFSAQLLGAFLFGLPFGILTSAFFTINGELDFLLIAITTIAFGYWCGLSYHVPTPLTEVQQIQLYNELAWPYPPSMYSRIEPYRMIPFKVIFVLICFTWFYLRKNSN